MNEQLYLEALRVSNYNGLALRAMALYAYEHRKDREAMKICSAVWQRNARTMAKAVQRFGAMFEPDSDATTDDYLSVFYIAQLNPADAAIVASEWQSKTLAAYQVKEIVDAKRKRTRRGKPLAERCAALLYKLNQTFCWNTEHALLPVDLACTINGIAEQPEIAAALERMEQAK